MTARLLCRIWQQGMRAGMHFTEHREPALVTGAGCVLKLPALLAERDVTRVLLVCGPTQRKAGRTDLIETALRTARIAVTVFSDLTPDPTAEQAEAAAEAYRRGNCGAIIAFGGGSPIDCAKAVGALIARPGKSVPDLQGVLKVRRPLPPLFVIPTTAGSGSETTPAAVITDEKSGRKAAVNDPVLVPDTAFLDPMLTVSMPPSLTAATGMDALCHAVEAFINHTYNTRKEDENAVRAVTRILRYLPIAYRDGNNVEARENMQLAAFEAGVAFSRGCVGYAHALGHPLSALYGVPHGRAVAAILPAVLRAYGRAAEKRLADLAERCGIGEEGMDRAARADAFIRRIGEMNASMCIPERIPDIRKKDIPKIAELAAREAHPLYPVPAILSRKQLEALVKGISCIS